MIKGLNHITIAVKDLDRSFSFYQNVLGMTLLMKQDRGAYFLAGDIWFCLDVDPTTRPQALPEYTHVAFSVSQEDFPKISEKIRAAKAQIWKENKSEGDSLYFLDPDGHKFEIHVGDWRSRVQSAKEKPWHPSLQFFEVPNSGVSLEVIPDIFAVTRLDPTEPIPDWAQRGSFVSISRTADELSIVCRQNDVPEGVKCERNWSALKVKGPLDFGLTGVLSSIVQPLALAGVSIFAISTFDTDYVLVKQENLQKAITTLEEASHNFKSV